MLSSFSNFDPLILSFLAFPGELVEESKLDASTKEQILSGNCTNFTTTQTLTLPFVGTALDFLGLSAADFDGHNSVAAGASAAAGGGGSAAAGSDASISEPPTKKAKQ